MDATPAETPAETPTPPAEPTPEPEPIVKEEVKAVVVENGASPKETEKLEKLEKELVTLKERIAGQDAEIARLKKVS